MRKIVQTGRDIDDMRRVIEALNYAEVILPFTVHTEAVVTVAGSPTDFNGIAVDRSVFRTLLPDARWIVYAAGFAATDDANTATISLVYQKDDTTVVSLGSVTHTGGFTKKVMGPFDVFATVGVPAGETVPMVRLRASKATAGNTSLTNWCIWLRLQAGRQ